MIFRRMPRRILSIENKLVIIFSDQFEGTTLILLKYVKIVKFWSALMCVCVYSFIEGARYGLYALNVNLTKLILQMGCPSYYLSSWRKQAPSHQHKYLKAFHQHKRAKKTKVLI